MGGGSGNDRRWCDKNRCHARARGIRGNRRSCDGKNSVPNSHNSAPNSCCSARDNDNSEPNTGCPEPNAHHSARDRDSSEPNARRSARNSRRSAPNAERSAPAHRRCVPSWKEAPHHEWWEVLVAAVWPRRGPGVSPRVQRRGFDRRGTRGQRGKHSPAPAGRRRRGCGSDERSRRLLRPSGAITISRTNSTGSATLKAASLHPRLQPGAPAGAQGNGADAAAPLDRLADSRVRLHRRILTPLSPPPPRTAA